MSLSAYFKSANQSSDSFLTRYSDLLLAAGVIAIIALMVVPLPPLAIDMLVALNIAFGMMLLLVAIYISSPLQFSVFPSVLLISTLFKLGLSIATTRMILLEGEAGQIIDTFGEMVVGGNLVVGLVVFLIITVVQFIVIAKGAERVAEVAARFSLDAMPGKQLSIDSDLRSGLIDKEEAKQKRRELEQESKLHGSLDGAMKFVKGDAIAGIVIIIINLLGGFAVGVWQQGMDMGEAMVKYSILTIGDGMVAQIPALLGAMSAGLIVTRATDNEKDKHLGDAIQKQLTAKPKALLVCGGMCWLFATVPGFPSVVFLLLGALLMGLGVVFTPKLIKRIERLSQPAFENVLKRKEATHMQVMATALPQVRSAVPLLLQLPRHTAKENKGIKLVSGLEEVLEDFQLQLGLSLPRIAIHAHDEEKNEWRLLAFEVPIAQGHCLAENTDDAIIEATRQGLRRHVALFLGIQETSMLLTRASGDYPEVVKEVLRSVPVQRLAEILRRLVEEEVPIRNIRDILEAVADASQREKDVSALSEHARIALKRQLSYRYAPRGELHAAVFDSELEETLRKSIRMTMGVQQLAIEPIHAKKLIDTLVSIHQRHKYSVIITSVDLRRHVRKLIEHDCFDLPVLSYNELSSTLKVNVVEHVDIPDRPELPGAELHAVSS